MKIIVIGGVAAGTKTAAKLKREIPDAEVVIYTKGKDISYAGCGLPYYIGGIIESRKKLIVNTPEKFSGLTNVEVHTESEVCCVDPIHKCIKITGEKEPVYYDKLVISVGAAPVIPPIEGTFLPGVFTVRTPDDAINIKKYAEENCCCSAFVVGGGFIGLEVAENLMRKGIKTTVADAAPQLLPNIFDTEMADYISRHLRKKGLEILTGTKVKKICGENAVESVVTDSGSIPAQIVVMAAGIRPATGFLAGSGIEMSDGIIITDEKHRTNLEDIFAVGDCAMLHNLITGRPQWSAMGSTANIAGRELALNLSGHETAYPGCLGTGIIRLCDDLNAARTGLTEKQAKEAGFDAISCLSILNDKAHYYEGSDSFIIKITADRKSRRLLGVQVLGAGTVDKIADIAVAGISLNARIDDFVSMDFAYAPPFSTAIHPLSAACSVLINKMNGKFKSISPAEYAKGDADDFTLIDAQPKPSIPGAEWIDFLKINEFAEKHKKDEKLLLVCTRGKRGYLAQNKLSAEGFTNAYVLEGGNAFNQLRKKTCGTEKLSEDSSIVLSVEERPAPPAKLPPEEIKRVKLLGCLQDKRFGDVFNVRVITKNGKITTQEHRCIAEAADRFGSGEVTMTTRQTLEIQGVPYRNLEPLFEFLAVYGLTTGGTGPLVRPVVSCKGTTCQYGLIDTYALSEKLHKRFYEGYHDIKLPHKFKIAVGGCPNNCVKPNLNDLGIVGQKRPLFDFSKCRGCKVCQIEKNCPIHTAKLVDGKLNVDPDECNHCGRCVGKCPFGVTNEYETGYKIYIGGRWGKKTAHGRALDKFFTDETEVLDTVEQAILFFKKEGQQGERFADTVTRLGFDYVQEQLLYHKLDKNEVLKNELK